MAKILITGGTGLVGSHLSDLLNREGHHVVHLSRSPGSKSKYDTYGWDVPKGEMDPKALEGVNHIIHLAGAGVADKRWTASRKKVIIDSRVESLNLLFKTAKTQNLKLDSFVSASAIGYYGMDTGAEWIDEASPSGNDFLAEVVRLWEQAADQFSELAPVSKVRIGVVLSDEGGAMPKIKQPIKYYVGAPLGDGEQYMSWVHIHDLCLIFKHALDQKLSGAYNACAPNPVTNETFTKMLAREMGKPLWLPNVPSFVLKAALGEMSQVVLGGNRVSSEKIRKAGFTFQYTEADSAIKHLLN